MAYQGGGRGIDIDWLIDLNNYATFALVPDITFLIDIRPEEAIRRLGLDQSTDRIEDEGIKFQTRVRKMYHDLADKFQDRYVLIDGHNSIDEIQEKLMNEIKRRGLLS